MWTQPDIPPLRSLPKQVEAFCFNQVCLALRRIGKPLRLALPRHKTLEIVLYEDGWLCVDAARDDLPVLAWHAFEVHGRETLHEPIDCRLELYHIHAGLVMGTVLDALQDALKECLEEGGAPEAAIHRLM